MSLPHQVGVIGLGLMGMALSRRLAVAGLPVVGFDIATIRCAAFAAEGWTCARSIRDIAACCPALVVAVYSAAQIETLLPDIVAGAGDARPLIVSTTTCTPDEAVRIAGQCANAGLSFVEMPISGTSTQVGDGTATALLSGDPDAVIAASDLATVMCPTTILTGSIGNASRTKLAINLILQSNRAALAEGIVFAEGIGLDGETFLRAARISAAYSAVMDTKGDKMIRRDYQPQSHIAQTLKDAELILAEADRHGLHLPLTGTQAGLLRAAIASEGPDSDSSAVIEAIRQPADKRDIA